MIRLKRIASFILVVIALCVVHTPLVARRTKERSKKYQMLPFDTNQVGQQYIAPPRRYVTTIPTKIMLDTTPSTPPALSIDWKMQLRSSFQADAQYLKNIIIDGEQGPVERDFLHLFMQQESWFDQTLTNSTHKSDQHGQAVTNKAAAIKQLADLVKDADTTIAELVPGGFDVELLSKIRLTMLYELNALRAQGQLEAIDMTSLVQSVLNKAGIETGQPESAAITGHVTQVMLPEHQEVVTPEAVVTPEPAVQVMLPEQQEVLPEAEVQDPMPEQTEATMSEPVEPEPQTIQQPMMQPSIDKEASLARLQSRIDELQTALATEKDRIITLQAEQLNMQRTMQEQLQLSIKFEQASSDLAQAKQELIETQEAQREAELSKQIAEQRAEEHISLASEQQEQLEEQLADETAARSLTLEQLRQVQESSKAEHYNLEVELARAKEQKDSFKQLVDTMSDKLNLALSKVKMLQRAADDAVMHRDAITQEHASDKADFVRMQEILQQEKQQLQTLYTQGQQEMQEAYSSLAQRFDDLRRGYDENVASIGLSSEIERIRFEEQKATLEREQEKVADEMNQLIARLEQEISETQERKQQLDAQLQVIDVVQEDEEEEYADDDEDEDDDEDDDDDDEYGDVAEDEVNERGDQTGSAADVVEDESADLTDDDAQDEVDWEVELDKESTTEQTPTEFDLGNDSDLSDALDEFDLSESGDESDVFEEIE